MPDQPRPEQRNEFTPRERGLLMGDLWARASARDHLRPVADGNISPEVRHDIEQFLVHSDDIENPSLFWGGFTHGVRAFVVELEQSMHQQAERE